MIRWNYALATTLALMLLAVVAPVALADDGETTTTTTSTTSAPETTTTIASTTTTTSAGSSEDPPPVDDGDPGDGEGLDPVVPERTPPKQVRRYEVVRDLVFPVVGPSYFHSSFGACRDNCTREHHGNDIMTWYWKGQPVVAATDGTITNMTYDLGNAGCSVRIRHRSGWETRYYHLNNDFPGTDDIGYTCGVPGLHVGDEVVAGQIIGYVGDSGNAETTPSHVHFELRMPNGYPVDPYKSLKEAERIHYEWLPSDIGAATRLLTSTVAPGESATTIVVTAQEADQVMASEGDSMSLDAPVVVVDLADPGPGSQEIRRLGSRAVVIMSDLDVRWLRDIVADTSTIVDVVPLPEFEAQSIHFVPDATQAPVMESNPVDQFATIIAGNTDDIWNSRQAAFHDYTNAHQSLVLDSTSRGTRYVGHRSTASPGKYADRSLVWWATGDGWVGTEPGAEPPDRGYAYVTERLATPWTLAFLGSLAETPPMPVWKSK